jgi:hypothetical protein
MLAAVSTASLTEIASVAVLLDVDVIVINES